MEGGLAATGGAGSWSVAFHSMLEGVLRDGEDMAVVMAYSTIRRHFRRLGYLLDEVTVGRLVVVQAAKKGNVLVGEEGDEKGEEQQRKGRGYGGPEGKGVEVDSETDTAKQSPSPPSPPSPPAESETQNPAPLALTGLRDWSSAIFGDPLLASLFSDPHQLPPSPSFLDGFNSPLHPSSSPTHSHPHQPSDHHHHHPPPNLPTPHSHPPTLPYPLNPAIIQSPQTAHIRLLLYQVYHAVARVVSEFYRPRQESSARELEARKKLNEVLARLGEVGDDFGVGVGVARSVAAAAAVAGGGDIGAAGGGGGGGAGGVDVAKRRMRRGSGEMSPAKRVRGGEDDD
jgi:hypothetical protein